MEVEKRCKIPYHNWELNFEYIDMIKDLPPEVATSAIQYLFFRILKAASI
jgi:hypothetical protein